MAGMQQGIVWPHGMMANPALINGAMLGHMPAAMMPQGKLLKMIIFMQIYYKNIQVKLHKNTGETNYFWYIFKNLKIENKTKIVLGKNRQNLRKM